MTLKAIDGHSNITEASLKSSKIFVIPEANIPFKRIRTGSNC